MKKLGVWILFLVVGNVIWLLLDKNPPAWDQAAHLRSIVLTNQWLRGNFWGNGIDLIKVFGGYPPLIYIIGGLWSLVTGVGVARLSFLNTFFLISATVGVYKLAKEVTRDENTSLLAAVLFSLFPVIYDISRNMLLDLALTGWVVWGLYFLMKKNETGMLAMLILASLTKLNGFIYFGPMFLLLAMENYRDREFWMRMVIGGAIYAVAVGWWWLVNFQNIYQYLTGLAGQGEALTDPMNLADWRTWLHYFKLFFLQQLGPIMTMVFLFLGKKENKKLVGWVLLTYVIFTIIKNKDFRFTMPILPVVAVWLGWGLNQTHLSLGKLGTSSLGEGRPKRIILGLILLWMGVNYVENSFNWPVKKPFQLTTPTFVLGDINWIDFSDYPVREFRTAVWPQRQIVDDLGKVYDQQHQKIRTLILMNREELNDNNLAMDKEMWGANVFETGSVGSVVKFENDSQITELLSGFQAVLVPGQDFDPAPFYGINLEAYKQVRDYIWNNKDKFQWVGEYQMPKYGKVYLIVIPLS